MLIKLTKKLLMPLASYLESVWSNLTFYLQTTLKSQTLWSFLAFQIVHKFLAKSNTRHKWSILYLLRCHLHQSFLMLSFLSPQLLPFKVWVGRVPQTFLWGFTKKFPPNYTPTPFCWILLFHTLRSTRSLVLETKAYFHRRPAYNPETFPHCPRWKRCCRLESFGAVHFSLIHHVTVSQLRFRCLSFLCWQFCMFIFCWPFFDVSKLLAHDVTRHSAANYI